MSHEIQETREQILDELHQALEGVRELTMEDLEKIYAGMCATDGTTV